MLSTWIENNYFQLKKICDKYSTGIDTEELCQSCIEQFMKNKKTDSIDDSQKIFFFTRIVTNNAASKSSPFYKENRSFKFSEFLDKDIPDEPYQEFDEWEWVKEQLNYDKRKGDWYYARLFEIYISLGCSVSQTSKVTTIPINSVSRDLNKYRNLLKQRRKERINKK